MDGFGDMQFKQFDTLGNAVVDTVVQMQLENNFAVDRPVLEVFMPLSYDLDDIRELITSPDAVILVLRGTMPNPAEDGALAAYSPKRNGTIVSLQQGDHDVFYDSSVAGGPLDLIRGYDLFGSLFTISNDDPATRTTIG
jgi:hypothetical protein